MLSAGQLALARCYLLSIKYFLAIIRPTGKAMSTLTRNLAIAEIVRLLRGSVLRDSDSTRLYGIRMRAQVSFVLSQCTCLTDRRMDRRTGVRNTVRCITCSRMVIKAGRLRVSSRIWLRSNTSDSDMLCYETCQKYIPQLCRVLDCLK